MTCINGGKVIKKKLCVSLTIVRSNVVQKTYSYIKHKKSKKVHYQFGLI